MSKKKQNIKKINCVQTVFSILKQLDTNNGEFVYCFRGQKLATYNLETSLERHIDIRNRYKDIIVEMIRTFPNDFSSLDNFTFFDLARMQHYGIPTDLLDVSFNPLVALFFATESAKGEKGIQKGKFIIFKIPKKDVRYANNERFVFDSTAKKTGTITFERGLLKVNLSFPRIKEQDGAFLYCDGKIPDEWIFKTFEIENYSKINIRKELATINITQNRLFPELSEYYKTLL